MSVGRQLDRRNFLRLTAGGATAIYLGGCARPRGPFVDLPADALGPVDKTGWADLAQMALSRIRRAGCDYGDIRLVETRSQTIAAENGRIAGATDAYDSGYGIRALFRGAWGFAASADFDPSQVERTAAHACEIARASYTLMQQPARLAPEPIHVDRVQSRYEIDPFGVALDDKCDLLVRVADALHSQTGIVGSAGWLWAQRDVKHFASTEGTRLDFDLLAVGAQFSATADNRGDRQSRSLSVPLRRAGYEHVTAHDLVGAAPRIAAEAVEKAGAAEVSPGTYDLILDPEHLSLLIHETCGHPSELDRALGFEPGQDGTFLTPDRLGQFRFGSEHVSLIADQREAGHLASTGYDDEGVAAQRWPVVQKGVFTGYSSSRETAGLIGAARSRGCSRAEGWDAVPIVRCGNIGLEPGGESFDSLIGGIRRGIYIAGPGAINVDPEGLRFESGGDACWEIKDGKRGAMLRNVVYRDMTPRLWNRCDGVADAAHRGEHGTITCVKGNPPQRGWMTHAASPARFRNIEVRSGR